VSLAGSILRLPLCSAVWFDELLVLLQTWPCRTSVCLTAESLQAINRFSDGGMLQLKVMSDDTAEAFINGNSVYTDPVADHNPK
jgi:hypothetical protein